MMPLLAVANSDGESTERATTKSNITLVEIGVCGSFLSYYLYVFLLSSFKCINFYNLVDTSLKYVFIRANLLVFVVSLFHDLFCCFIVKKELRLGSAAALPLSSL